MGPHSPVDDGGEGEVVEDLGAVAPRVRVAVLALALVVEAVHLSGQRTEKRREEVRRHDCFSGRWGGEREHGGE